VGREVLGGAEGADLRGGDAFVVAVVPFGDVGGDGYVGGGGGEGRVRVGWGAGLPGVGVGAV
jgi:hypothetical protein